MKIAIYTRVSRDDINNSLSVSIQTQIEYIKNYLSENELYYTDIYIDDGCSGATFDRPDFKRMMTDIDLGIIDCIIVKDLSRLGRNYIEVGRYLDEIFPNKNVRLISINDNYDSISDNDDTIAIRNFLNGLYLKDCEKKARLQVKRRCETKDMTLLGQYGYKIENDNIVIDEEVAPIVRRIFNEYASGKSILQIARDLNNDKIINPSYYRYQRLGKSSSVESLVKSKGFDKYQWSKSTVKKIIGDEEYTGITVNRIYSRERSKKCKRVHPYILYNTREALISKELFDKCKELREQKTPNTKASTYPRLINKPTCGCCGIRMQFVTHYGVNKTEDNATYFCKECKNKVRAKLLHEALYMDAVYVIKNIKSSKFKIAFRKGQFDTNEISFESLMEEKKKIEASYEELFEQMISGIITDMEYNSKLELLSVKINKIAQQLKKYDTNLHNDRLYDYNYELFIKRIESLTNVTSEIEILNTLIKEVIVKKNQELELTIKYQI